MKSISNKQTMMLAGTDAMQAKLTNISMASGILMKLSRDMKQLIDSGVVGNDKAIDMKQLVKSKPLIKHRKKSFMNAKAADKHNERAPGSQ